MFLLGHSMGGAIAVSYALAHQDRLTGLILSAPLAALEAAPAPMRIAARVLSALAPKLPLFPIDPTLVSRDPAVVEAYIADPAQPPRQAPGADRRRAGRGDRFVP